MGCIDLYHGLYGVLSWVVQRAVCRFSSCVAVVRHTTEVAVEVVSRKSGVKVETIVLV